jgi:DNA invertase Pin-like site-specific DNA recombinase
MLDQILKTCRYAYARISFKSQESNLSIESQKQQLIQNGIEEQNIFVEVGSGANEIKNRSIFQKLINQKLKENDLLMFTKMDSRRVILLPASFSFTQSF